MSNAGRDTLQGFKEHTAILYLLVLLVEAGLMLFEKYMHMNDDFSFAFLVIALVIATVYGIMKTRYS